MTTLNHQTFKSAYSEPAPWDIDGPQPALASKANQIHGSILDAGCGTGENALLFASKGHAVTGFDFVEEPVERAKAKAKERGLKATFLTKDALTLSDWNERFESALDSGLFHVFSDDDRQKYVSGLKTVIKPGGHFYLLCFSDKTPGTQGPRRVTEKELRAAFSQGWSIESLELTEFEIRPELRSRFPDGLPKAWFMTAKRL
ncbi:MAG: class I SAM-dependent methyltransferase [Bdellovibrionota bacterium]